MTEVSEWLDLTPIMSEVMHGSLRTVPATELGFFWTEGNSLLTFATSTDFLQKALSNSCVSVILVDENVDVSQVASRSNVEIVIVRNAKLNFYRLHNSLRKKQTFEKTQIHPSASVHSTAVIDDYGVKIGGSVVIEPYVRIIRGTTIAENSIVRSGSTLGSDALDIRMDENGNPSMTDHLGGVEIGSDVEIGPNCVIDRAIFRQTKTVIGAYTKIGCLSNISHGASLGSRNTLAAGVKICGSTIIGSNNWFGPNSTVSNLLTIGSHNHIALGATLFSSIGDHTKVIGTRAFSDRRLF